MARGDAEVARALERLAYLLSAELAARARGRRAEDRLRSYGQRPLARVGVHSYLEAIPGLAARFSKTVPEEMYARGEENLVEVSCPCGEVHQVELGGFTFAARPCGRAFIWDGQTVFVASPIAT